MTRLFLNSMNRYGGWIARSVLPGRHAGAELNGRRLLFLVCLPLFLAVQLLHWLCLALDELLFPGYRETPVTAPVFITGIPRSGTTFLHRALAADERFTVFTTWEVLLAPSIVQRRCVRALAALDRCLGAPCHRLLHAAFRRAGEGLDDIHPVSLSEPEEDYLLLLPAASCFFLLLAFPFDPWLRRLPTPARLSDAQRHRLFNFHHRLLQRHLYAAPGSFRLLSKNAAFAGWPPYLLARYPDARILLCVREPEAALASQLRALAPARAVFGTDADGSFTEALFGHLYRDFYVALAAFARIAPPGNVRIVIQEEMRDNSGAIIAALCGFLEAAPASEPGTTPVVADHSVSERRVNPASGSREPSGEEAFDAYRYLLDSPLRVGAGA